MLQTPPHPRRAQDPVVESGVVPKWILVADDNDSLRELWTVVLTGARYRVVTARNGREALDLTRAVVPDLIMLDLRMPEMDGAAFLEVFERAPVLKRIPVLIVSGFLEDEAPHTSLGLNIVGRLSKPVRVSDLLDAVRTALAPVRHRLPLTS
jgi:two-component system cell cycle response regulator DivK